MDETIFVGIAAYRDPECFWTIRDLFEKARNPDRVFCGVCWQLAWPEDRNLFPGVIRPAQLRFRGFDHRLSRGCSWAKHQAQQLYNGEDYQLTIDSHMRFHEGWDESLIGMLGECDSSKPVLSFYPAPYEPPDRLDGCLTAVIVPKELPEERGAKLYLSSVPRSAEAPVRGAFLAGGFLFSRAALIEEVPFDPHLYFIGLELSLSVRAWTRGWDVFCPHRCVAHHRYMANDIGTHHWDDDRGWYALEAASQARLSHLVGLEQSADERITQGLDGEYGLGSARSLDSFWTFTGLDLAGRTIAAYGERGEFGQRE